MNFTSRQLSLKNLVGFPLVVDKNKDLFDDVTSEMTEFKKIMLGNDFFTDGPVYFSYLPGQEAEPITVFTTIGNRVEITGDNELGLFYQEKLDIRTDYYYRHYNQNELIPYDEIQGEIESAGLRLVNIIHVILDLYGDYVIDLYCEVEKG